MQRSDSFFNLLYRYLWPFWLFRDASRGSMLERAAAYRYNRELRRYLPGYACKWAVLTGFQGAIMAGCEQAAAVLHEALLWIAAAFGTTASASVAVIAICLAAWAYLSFVEG
jgi:hypothetical protein